MAHAIASCSGKGTSAPPCVCRFLRRAAAGPQVLIRGFISMNEAAAGHGISAEGTTGDGLVQVGPPPPGSTAFQMSGGGGPARDSASCTIFCSGRVPQCA